MEPEPSDGFEWAPDTPTPALVCRPLLETALHLFTTRSWKLGSPAANPDLAWAEVARAAGVAPDRLVRVRQVHRAGALIVKRGDRGVRRTPVDADIIATDDPNLGIAVQAADCAPILIGDRTIGVVAAAHAGWRGLAARVPSAAVRALTEAWGSRPEDLVAAIGPSIGACCYEVGRDVRERFETAGFSLSEIETWFGDERPLEHWRFDGRASARDQLKAAGVPASRIHVSGLCTGCFPERFCSYRLQGAATGRLAAVIRARASG